MYIKRVFILIVIACQSLWGQYYIVTNIKSNDTLSIRSKPSIYSKKIGELPYNASHIYLNTIWDKGQSSPVCIKTKSKSGVKEWCELSHLRGWVARKYLKKSDDGIRQEPKYKNKNYKVIRHSMGETLKVRLGASSKYNMVAKLRYDEKIIDILSCKKSNKSSKWCWIYYGENITNPFGWVFSKYLQDAEIDNEKNNGEFNAIPYTKPVAISYHKVLINLNIREKPDKKSNVIEKLKKGDHVEIVRILGEWGEVIDSGFVSMKHLSLTRRYTPEVICYTKMHLLNKHFNAIEHSNLNEENKLKDLLNRVYQHADVCPNTYFDSFSSADGCTLGVDNLLKAVKLQIKEPKARHILGCESLSTDLKKQATVLSYDKKQLNITFVEDFKGSGLFKLKEMCRIYDNNTVDDYNQKCVSEKKKILDKAIACKNKLVNLRFGLEGGYIYDLICDNDNKYSGQVLQKECKAGNADRCYQLVDYLYNEKPYRGIDPIEASDYAISLKKKNNLYKEVDLAQNYNQSGRIYIDKGDNLNALKFLKKGLVLRENSLGKDHIETAESYHEMGIYYKTVGDYPKALQYLKKALNIREKSLAKEHIDTAKSYHAIGVVYGDIGKYKESLKLLEKALIIHKNTLGSNTMKITYIYNSIGEVYSLMSKYKLALKNFKKALSIRVELLNENHVDTLIIYTNIANAYMGMKDYAKAEKKFQKSIVREYRFYDTISPKTITGLGLLHLFSKEYRQALYYFKRAQKTQEKILGDKHPDTAMTYYNIGTLYSMQKKYGSAYDFSKKAFNAFLSNRDKNFQIQNNRQKELYLKGNSNKIKLLLGTAYQYTNSNQTNAKTVDQNVFTSWLNYKGSIFDSENMIASLYTNTNDKALKAKISELLAQKRYLANLYQSLPRPKEKETWKQNIIDAEEKISTLTNKISYKATNFKEQQGLKSISFKDISKKLKENELYIDYASVGKKYYVFSLDSKDNIVFNEISEEDRSKIDMLIKTFREDIALILNESNISDDKLKQLTDNSKEKLSELYELVLQKPLSKELKEKTNLILSPDGALRLLPFEAMLNKQNGQYLIEQKEIRYIPSGKELVRLYKYSDTDKTNKQDNNVVIFSNPDFNEKLNKLASLNKEEMALTPNTSRAGIIKSLFKMRFNPLPGTKEEAESIKQTLAGKDKIDEYTEASASEVNLVKINKPKILHIATHGFFINDNTIPNPMLKSGIALSGANASAIKGKSDGIVTALKLSGLDLKGTDLVVLSACQTGVVDVNSTESVSGLSKAFIQAGAKDIVMSLWSVNDQATKDLMSSFYKEMQIQPSYAKALKEAKLKMIKKDMHPFFWAPFVVNGL